MVMTLADSPAPTSCDIQTASTRAIDQGQVWRGHRCPKAALDDDIIAPLRTQHLRDGARSSSVSRLAAFPLTILIVERDPHVRALATQFLADAGHRVEVSTDGNEALAKVRTLLPDLVVCEILVPKLDGLALCRQLKANEATRHILVLVVSILAAAARANDAGADGFLLKPLAQHRLIAMVQGLAEKRSSVGLQQERA